MGIDVFPLVVAALPLATYFLLLGSLRLTRRPLVTTGGRDLAAVGVAVSGLVSIGPVQLFFPSMAAAQMGMMVWFVLGMLYVLCVALVVFSMRPTVVIYGLRVSQASEVLRRSLESLDAEVHIDEESGQVVLPSRGIRLRIDPLGITDAVQVEAFQRNLHPRFWKMLISELRAATRGMRVPPSLGGAVMLAMGLGLFGGIASLSLNNGEELLAGFREFLQL